MKLLFLFGFLLLFLFGCSDQNSSSDAQQSRATLTCTDASCEGIYEGLEFENGTDVAHQFSNRMAKKVGKRLKTLYDLKKFSRVDFSKISMSTKGMGSGKVTYALKIPFERVADKCDASTAFDHCGGWNHTPSLKKRLQELQSALAKGEKLNVSSLKKTNEGLQEYWIQWRHKTVQKDCF